MGFWWSNCPKPQTLQVQCSDHMYRHCGRPTSKETHEMWGEFWDFPSVLTCKCRKVFFPTPWMGSHMGPRSCDLNLLVIKFFLMFNHTSSLFWNFTSHRDLSAKSLYRLCAFSKFVATLALGSGPKQRGCKGAGQEKTQESHHILLGV